MSILDTRFICQGFTSNRDRLHSDQGLPTLSASDLADAAQKIVKAVEEKK